MSGAKRNLPLSNLKGHFPVPISTSEQGKNNNKYHFTCETPYWYSCQVIITMDFQSITSFYTTTLFTMSQLLCTLGQEKRNLDSSPWEGHLNSWSVWFLTSKMREGSRSCPRPLPDLMFYASTHLEHHCPTELYNLCDTSYELYNLCDTSYTHNLKFPSHHIKKVQKVGKKIS